MNKLLITITIFVFFYMDQYTHGSCPTIITRYEWGGENGTNIRKFSSTPTYIVIHHSETPQCSNQRACKSRVKNIQHFHIHERHWDDIGYNFLIGGDGMVYEGRGYGVIGAHVPKYNSRSLGICLIGNYQSVDPPQAQLDTLQKLISCAVDGNHVTSDYKLIGHRQGKATDCPGDKLYAEVKKMPHWERNPQ